LETYHKELFTRAGIGTSIVFHLIDSVRLVQTFGLSLLDWKMDLQLAGMLEIKLRKLLNPKA
jgi:hypothetical protein